MIARRGGRVAALSGRRLYSATASSGIKLSAVDTARPVSELKLVVKAGSRYAAPGLAHLLEKYAYRNTASRSALRLTRESELLGGQLSTSLSRESLVLTAKFMKEDLPYYVNALADVAQNTLYKQYEFDEDVLPLAKVEAAVAATDSVYVALEKAYEVAFRSGLGTPLLYQPYSPVSNDAVKDFGLKAYTKASVELVGTGIVESDLASIAANSKFADLPAGSALASDASSTFSGESRVGASTGDAVVLAFPSTASAATLAALSKALGAKSTIKWSLGQSPLATAAAESGASITADVASFSDASLLYVTITGDSSAIVSAGAKAAAAAVKSLESSLSEETVKRAVALAKFADAESTVISALDFGSVSSSSLKSAAAELAGGKKVVSVVGNVGALPYADELF